ncbi:hypothetical protein POF50_034890 [Streptomyces sp. SL13]|uniref:Uncharacterized protein n=1 Tax=Streptantibioticus silvisoli TaxID=2705255 RepID=A0AA90HAQ4_9ACTN|nr:hypothetical protein [Streptantibioticus silvisoli]MDI5974476.1 hypothetical protein [Streptantibioticus silvisoli]
MLDLSAEAFGIAVRPYDDYLPLAGFADAAIPASRLHQESRGIPLEHLMLVATDDTQDIAGEPDVTALALAALGAPDHEQPLFLVRGALRDSMVAALAGLVHASQWAGEDTGITHLEELGGTVVFDLLDWAVPEDSRATVLICDEPLVADARVGHAQFAAVGLRLRHGPGPLQVLDCGEGPPGAAAAAAAHRFGGSGPCDAWVALHAALTAGRVRDGDQVLLGVSAPLRQGWVLLRVADTAGLRLAVGGPAHR